MGLGHKKRFKQLVTAPAPPFAFELFEKKVIGPVENAQRLTLLSGARAPLFGPPRARAASHYPLPLAHA